MISVSICFCPSFFTIPHNVFCKSPIPYLSLVSCFSTTLNQKAIASEVWNAMIQDSKDTWVTNQWQAARPIQKPHDLVSGCLRLMIHPSQELNPCKFHHGACGFDRPPCTLKAYANSNLDINCCARPHICALMNRHHHGR